MVRYKYLIALGIIVFAILGMVCVMFLSRVEELENIVEQKTEIQLALIQKLDAGITFQSKRQKYLLETRDIIMRVAKQAKVKISLDTAYSIAEANLKYSTKYGIDANFLLSIQTKENRFHRTRKSPAGAQGPNQIWEPTGRMICQIFDWEYYDGILEDIDKSTEIAAFLISVFNATYNKYNNCMELVAAAYNGGARNAHYYRIKSNKLAAETAEYVPAVMEIYEEYRKLTGMYLAGIISTSSSSS